MTEEAKTDILFVTQSLPSDSWINALVTSVTAPLGLAYLASYVEQKGFRPKILDNSIRLMSRNRFKDYLRRTKPSLVGFTSSTSTFLKVMDFALAVKEYDSRIKVILGGPHPSALPEDVLGSDSVDIVVKGEGEETILELLNSLLREDADLSDIKGIAYREGRQIRNNPPRELIRDIDTLPFPAYHLLPMSSYRHSPFRRVTAGRSASVITSRGCAYNCTFCSNSVFGTGVRYRSPENVLDEIKYLVKNYSVGEIIFRDDAFTLDIERAKAIALGIKEIGKDIKWSCFSRVNHASEVLYDLFYKSGCREICFGAESSSQAILDKAKKQIVVSDILKAINLCRKYKISSLCSVIIGLPGDTEAAVTESIRFFSKANPDYIVFCLLVPMPGSELFNTAQQNDLVDRRNLSHTDYVKIFSSALPPVSMCDIPRERLVELQKQAFREFYLRPGFIAKKLSRCISPMFINQMLQIERGTRAFIGHQMHKFTTKVS